MLQFRQTKRTENKLHYFTAAVNFWYFEGFGFCLFVSLFGDFVCLLFLLFQEHITFLERVLDTVPDLLTQQKQSNK